VHSRRLVRTVSRGRSKWRRPTLTPEGPRRASRLCYGSASLPGDAKKGEVTKKSCDEMRPADFCAGSVSEERLRRESRLSSQGPGAAPFESARKRMFQWMRRFGFQARSPALKRSAAFIFESNGSEYDLRARKVGTTDSITGFGGTR
jgi:hypothetical protein